METSFITRWHSVFNNPFYFIRKRLYKSIKKNAPQLQGDMLDFGCGAKPYALLFAHCKSYTGLDVEKSGHSHEKETIDVFYDGKNIPFSDNHFDSVLSSEVFEHIFNLEEMLKEINRVMKPGAKLLITCPFAWPEHEIPYDFARYSSYGIKDLLTRNGFAIVHQEKTGHFFEVVMQLWMVYIFYWIPKKPLFIYYIFHQLFILPIILFSILAGFLLPSRMKRKDLYHNNMIVAEKQRLL